MNKHLLLTIHENVLSLSNSLSLTNRIPKLMTSFSKAELWFSAIKAFVALTSLTK